MEKQKKCFQCGRQGFYRSSYSETGYRSKFVCFVCGFRAWITVDRDLKNGKPYRLNQIGFKIDKVYTRKGHGSSLLVFNNNLFASKIFIKPVTDEDIQEFIGLYNSPNVNREQSYLIAWNGQLGVPVKTFENPYPFEHPKWDPSSGRVLCGHFHEQHQLVLQNIVSTSKKLCTEFSGHLSSHLSKKVG